jgi:hypothetical protein
MISFHHTSWKVFISSEDEIRGCLVVTLFHQILKKKLFKINFFNVFESFG